MGPNNGMNPGYVPIYGYPFLSYPQQPQGQQTGLQGPQTPPQQQGVTNPQPSFICRPVASYEEAVAAPTDFNGNILIMTDLYHGMIYTKMLDPKTGSSVFGAYRYVQPQPQTNAPVADKAAQYAPVSEFQRLEQEVEALRGELAEMKKAAQKKPAGKGTEA